MKKKKYEKTPRQLKKLLVDAVSKSIESPECALLLSGGVDSISVGLAAKHAGKKVHAYSFHLDTHESYDYKKAREVSEYMGWLFTGVVVPTTNIPEDFRILAKMGCSKKTHFECVFPFLYMYPKIKEKYVLTGWGADGYIGVSRKAEMRYSKPQRLWNYHEWCMRTNSKFMTWNEFRNTYFLPENCAGHLQHEKVVTKHNKIMVNPYMEKEIKDVFYSFNWQELNIPIQKHHARTGFCEFEKFGIIKEHENLHLGAGVDKVFGDLLNNDKINLKNRKRMMDVCRDWYKKEQNGILPI